MLAPKEESTKSVLFKNTSDSSLKQATLKKERSVMKLMKERSTREIAATPRFSLSRIFMLRAILIASLLTAVAVCASLSYKLLRDAELLVGLQKYESIAASALSGAQTITLRKVQGSEVMATLISQILPDKEDWPFIAIEGYIPIAEKVAQLSSSTTQSLMVILQPSQAPDFEAHAKQVYLEQGRPEQAGYSDFGFGVWKPDAECEYADCRSHDTDGSTSWGGQRDGQVMTTLMMHNQPAANSLMYNVYSEADRGLHIDSMFDCVERNTNTSISPECAVITDMLTLKVRPGPAGLLFQPIFPAHDPSVFVGFATTSIHWQEVLESVVPDYVNGLTCVVSTDTNSYTYEMRGGQPELVGEGDRHDRAYSHHGKSVILNDISTGSLLSKKYQLTVYPTAESFDEFSTTSPRSVSLGFCGAILACTLIFFMYDHLMRRDAQQRKDILEMRRRFVRFISHEIRTPLNTVCMGLELLDTELRGGGASSSLGLGEDKVVEEDVDFWHNVVVDIDENAHIAVSILNDLLNHDKLEMGTLKLDTAPIFIWDSIERTVNQFRIQGVNRKINLNFNLEKPQQEEDLESGLDLWNMIGDDVRLSQVFRNVISNALKFTPPDGTIEVTASHVKNGLPGAKPIEGEEEFCITHPRAGSIRIAVKDSGVGLTKDQLQQLFGEGVQFDANRLQHGGGSGLGLNIAKGLVEQHQGTIRAESEGNGHGTTFIIELPLYEFTMEELKKDDDKDSTSQPTATTATLSTTKEERVFPPSRILVAEDAASSRKMLIRLLERSGHTCVPATNGQEALTAIEADMQVADPDHIPIDTILMDFEMPLLTGPEATKKIREIGYKGMIIGVTGNVLEEDVEFFKDHGANDVFSKPVSMEIIKAYLERQKGGGGARKRN